MGRVRVEKASLKSWDEVDQSLKKIADALNEIAIVESAMNMQIDAIKSANDDKIKAYRDDIKKHEIMIKEFTGDKRDELNGKSRDLTFGKVGFRKSTKVVLPKMLDKVIKALKKNDMADCVVVKESVNKDLLKTYPEEAILKVGGSLKVEDTFWYETKQVDISKVG